MSTSSNPGGLPSGQAVVAVLCGAQGAPPPGSNVPASGARVRRLCTMSAMGKGRMCAAGCNRGGVSAQCGELGQAAA